MSKCSCEYEKMWKGIVLEKSIASMRKKMIEDGFDVDEAERDFKERINEWAISVGIRERK